MSKVTSSATSDQADTLTPVETHPGTPVAQNVTPVFLPNTVPEDEIPSTPPTPPTPAPALKPLPPRACPHGLEFLKSVDHIFIQQQTALFEKFTDFETQNMYEIKDKNGATILYAAEQTCCCLRSCWGALRSFDMGLFNSVNHELVHIRRPQRADCCFFPCCLQKASVYTPNVLDDVDIGFVKQKFSVLKPKFAVCDPDGNEVLYIRGPLCTSSCCGNVDFPIYARDSATIVGKISQEWPEMDQEFLAKADYYGVSFPIDLDVTVKISVIAACFLIDFMYFSHSNNDNKAII